MATTHYDFPTINGADAIDGVNAINGLANAVDTALFTVDSALGTAESSAAQAISDAAAASTAAAAANTNASAAQQSATAAQQSAAAAVQTANNTASTLNTFEQKFNLVPQRITSGLAMTGFTYDLSLAQSGDGTIFKFYGNVVKPISTSGSATRVTIPGGSGNYSYGVATGLFLNTKPNTAYMVSPAGIRTEASSSATTALYGMEFAVGTDGQIYILPQSTSTGGFDSSKRWAVYYWPCIYFNGSFGDIGE